MDNKYTEIEKLDSIVKEVVSSWGFTNLNLDENIFNVKKWLYNFESSEIPTISQLLPIIRLERDTDLNNKIKFLCNKLKDEFGNEINMCNFYGLEKNPSSSGNHLLYKIKKELGLSDSNFPEKIESENYQINIFFDDFIGSGNQATNYFNRNLRELKSESYYCSLYGFVNGINRVKENAQFKKVIVAEILNDNHRFENQKIDKECLEIALKYGKKLFPKHPLGYENSQSLICFLKECPNNTLPIIWAGQNNESSKEIDWHPLFERRKSRKLKNNIPLFVVKDMFQINQFSKEISNKHDINLNKIKDTESFVRFVNSNVFIYEFDKKETWYKCDELLPITEKIADYALAQGLVSKELVNLLTDIGRLNKHRNREEKAFAYFALGSKTLVQLKKDLDTVDYMRLKYQINHYEIQKNISLADEQDELCKSFDSIFNEFNNAKCNACVFIRRNRLDEAKKYLYKCLEELEVLEADKSLYEIKNGKLEKSRKFKYLLAYFYRTVAQFYIKMNKYQLAKGYSVKSLELFSNLEYLNHFTLCFNYYQLYEINEMLGNKSEAKKYFKLSKDSRKGNLLFASCLVDVQEMDRKLGIR